MPLSWCTGLQGRAKVIVDDRQIVDPEKVRKLGLAYKGIGYRQC